MNEPDAFRFPSNYPDVLEHIGQIVYRELRAHGICREKSAEIAIGTTDSVGREFGGSQIYVPRGVSYRLSQRDAEIFRKFKGDNYAQLAREYQLTEVRVRSIIKDCLEFERLVKQGNLF